MTRTSLPVIGVDLGGTKVLSALIGPRARVLATDHRPTQAARGFDVVVENVVASVRAAARQGGVPLERVMAVGLGTPGISNPRAGIVYRSPNLPGWEHVPFRQIVEERLGVKTFLINDANAAALGEMKCGAARGTRDFVYVTISTGIGGGIVVNGGLYTGAAGMAGEVGHIVVEPRGLACNCGGAGCWEMYASGTAMARRARERIQGGARTVLVDMSGGKPERVDPSLIKTAAEAGDTVAQELIAETADYLAIGFGGLINVFNPEMIVVGGGLSKMGDMLLGPAFRGAAHWSYADAYRVTRFVMAELGDRAGVLGAAAHARDELKHTDG